ncbi:MAG: hypothetical protein IPI35_33730 [Deltaproteobacteria bacterium]|nr:hypothetical protein [Deltaproteobacteria bacterium]
MRGSTAPPHATTPAPRSSPRDARHAGRRQDPGFAPAVNPAFGEAILPPRVTRAMIADRGYQAALAFQTRNPLHRAHEYALVYGAEVLTRQGFYTGVVLNPLIGELKGDDVDAATRMRTYARSRQPAPGPGRQRQGAVGVRGYDLNSVFHLVGLDIRMFDGGPAEAVMHAIYRQNHGFTTSSSAATRRRALPRQDAIWGDFDAQEIFGNLQGALSTKPVNVASRPTTSPSAGWTSPREPPQREAPEHRRDEIREALVSGDLPDPRASAVRLSTADILIEAYRAQG